MKKILDGEGDGEEETSGDGSKNDGDGEFEGLCDGETRNCDGEKGLETGDDGGRFIFSSFVLILGELVAFADCCRSCLLNAISSCWPRCL